MLKEILSWVHTRSTLHVLRLVVMVYSLYYFKDTDVRGITIYPIYKMLMQGVSRLVSRLLGVYSVVRRASAFGKDLDIFKMTKFLR